VGQVLSLDASSSVSDGGSLTYKWYQVDDEAKTNPRLLPLGQETYSVDTSLAGTSYYYCQVTNTNNGVNGNKTATIETSVAKITVTLAPPSSKSMVSYDPVTLSQTGDIANNNVQYQRATAVINALPTKISVKLEDDSRVDLGLTWQDIDGYNPSLAGDYTFGATWASLPANVDNNEGLEAPRCDLRVVQGTSSGGSGSNSSSSSSGSSSNSTVSQSDHKLSLPKSVTKKAYEAIEKVQPNEEGVIKVSVQTNLNSQGENTYALPSNFIDNSSPVELTLENDDLQITFSNTMFTEKPKSVEVVFGPTNKEDLGLSEEDQMRIGDNPIYSINLNVNDETVDWSSDKNIDISISFNKNINEDDHNYVAVYYDRNGNIEILKSSYYQDGKVYFTTKHLSDYGIMYVDSTFEDIEDHWAQDAIEALAARNVIKGVSGHEFRPETHISRADIVTLMVRFFEFESVNKETSTAYQQVFKDVECSKYYGESVAIAKEVGLVKGCGDDFFRPEAPISREDMAVLLHRAMTISSEFSDLTPSDLTYLSCSDCIEVSQYAENSVEAMVNSQVLNTKLMQIRPKENATRAEIAHALYNILKSNM
jgi:hypothetical protein